MESVSQADARKALFLTQYKRLCDVTGMMVVWTYDKANKYRAFSLLDMGDSRDELEKAILEMQMEDLI